MGQNALLYIPLTNVEENPVALREVDKDSIGYQQLRDSIKNDGLLNAITVVPALMADGKTPRKDSAGNLIYRIVDGLHRTTACRDLNFAEIPAQVLNKSDQDVMVSQLVANAHKVETKPFQYSRHLMNILANDPTMTVAELATKLSMSTEWLNRRLGLVNLHPDIGKLVDDDKITVSNGVDLAKLRPVEEQLAFVNDAQSDQPAVFGPKVKARIKALRDAKRAGRDPEEAGKFIAVPHVRKPGDLKAELEAPTVLPALIKAAGITDPVQAAAYAIRWVLCMDEQSIRSAEARHEQRKKDSEAAKLKAAADRAARKAQETAAQAAAISK